MKKHKPMFSIDFPTPDGYGKVGFIFFIIAFFLIMFMSIWFDWKAMLVAIVIFICGGLAGRGFEKNTVRKEDAKKEEEKKTSVEQSEEDS